MDWSAISAEIGQATRQPFQIMPTVESCRGGCINKAYRIHGRDGRQFFVKLNAADMLDMLAAEQEGLNAIAITHTLRSPKPIALGIANGCSFLVLEYLELCDCGNAALFGEQLAALHGFAAARMNCRKYGYSQDNFIGTTKQQNSWKENWVDFWCEHRLGFQLHLAAENGYDGSLQESGARLLEALPAFFAGYMPQPSLLHGDLWGGNHAFLPDGAPVIFDPAPFYGDRECDLAMTELFGGYKTDFYASYHAVYPLDKGYSTRRDIYNLYHILNHANLFGGSYARQAEQMMRRLLAIVDQ